MSWTIEQLRTHLQAAILLEHYTIPAYLCAMWTIKAGANVEPSYVIRSVVIEEMLHMALAANVLNAVGGHPVVAAPNMVPVYPSNVPYTSIPIALRRFDEANVRSFAAIEQPGPDHLKPMLFGAEVGVEKKYGSIEEFYDDIEAGLRELNDELGPKALFSGDPGLQVGPEVYYGGGGGAVEVRDLKTALRAIDLIVAQGEGAPGSIKDDASEWFDQRNELAHYFRFKQILEGRFYRKGDTPASGPTGKLLRVNWTAVYDMVDNPKLDMYPEGTELRAKAEDFARTYTTLLAEIEAALNGRPESLRPATARMYDLRYRAEDLIRNPLPAGNGLRAGPPFEWLPLSDGGRAGTGRGGRAEADAR